MIVHLLGTGSAGAGPDRTTTMLAVEADGRLVLVDCGGDAVQRMLACGLDPLAVDAVILTHEHPDHISGYPLLIEKMWLRGRSAPIPVYGPGPTIEKAEALFSVFNTERWEGLPERRLQAVEMTPGTRVLTLGDFSVAATPVDHPVPTIGLRFETDDVTVAYSCDTAPTTHVVDLARDADLLIHEATGALPGVHSSPEEAAAIAAEAGVQRLVLVHAPAGLLPLDAARATFPATTWGADGDRVVVTAAVHHPEPSR